MFCKQPNDFYLLLSFATFGSEKHQLAFCFFVAGLSERIYSPPSDTTGFNSFVICFILKAVAKEVRSFYSSLRTKVRNSNCMIQFFHVWLSY